jgi:transposase InsO family protein
MRIFNKFKRTRGFISVWQEVVRWRDMITEEAERRYRILVFWDTHGLKAVLDAFPVKRRSLFAWKKKLKEGGGKVEALNPGSRAPKVKRKRLWDERIITELKRLREIHPNLGKEKLHPLLLEFCASLKLTCPKPKTIGRLIKDLGGLRRFPQKVRHNGQVVKATRAKVLRKPKEFRALYPGHCVALDTIEIIIFGVRRYVITAIDLHSRYAFAYGTSSHASLAAAEFFELWQRVFPFPMTFVLTDNGSEFKKNFSLALCDLHLIHYHTYPRTPKMNAHAERFNRTVQEEFVTYYQGLMATNLPEFNRRLAEYLCFYNLKRVHHAFGNRLSPVQFLLSLPVSTLPTECKRGWPHTNSSQKTRKGLEYQHISHL